MFDKAIPQGYASWLARGFDRDEGARGKIRAPKTAIGTEGAVCFAMISDIEGNTVGLHSQGSPGERIVAPKCVAAD